MTTKNKTITGAFCFLLAAGMAAEARELASPPTPVTQSPYPVVDSGVWADPISSHRIYWIDNNRILFKSVKDNDKTRISSGPFSLLVWDIGKGITTYIPYSRTVDVCVSDGIVMYSLEDERGINKTFFGKFGEEKPATPGKISYIDDINCRLADNPEIVAVRKNNRAVRPLLDRHGYLDIGLLRESSTSKEFITLYRPGDKQGISLPIPAQYIDDIRYYEFKQAYLIFIRMAGKRFWWLYPDGKVDEVLTPFGAGLATRQGLVVGLGRIKSDYDPGTAGIYLWSGQRTIKLIGGYTQGIVVSPDGCKLAFAHYPYLKATSMKDPGRVTLKMINLCTEKTSHG